MDSQFNSKQEVGLQIVQLLFNRWFYKYRGKKTGIEYCHRVIYRLRWWMHRLRCSKWWSIEGMTFPHREGGSGSSPLTHFIASLLCLAVHSCLVAFWHISATFDGQKPELSDQWEHRPTMNCIYMPASLSQTLHVCSTNLHSTQDKPNH